MTYREAEIDRMSGVDGGKRPIMGYSGNLTIRPGDLIAELFENRETVDEEPTPIPVIVQRSAVG
jgi:hypothetical protein